jgi:hypothetical protein
MQTEERQINYIYHYQYEENSKPMESECNSPKNVLANLDASKEKKSKPYMKRLRLRGDWSDTG